MAKVTLKLVVLLYNYPRQLSIGTLWLSELPFHFIVFGTLEHVNVPTIDQGDVEPCHDKEEDKYVHKYKLVLGSNSVFSFVVTCTLYLTFFKL